MAALLLAAMIGSVSSGSLAASPEPLRPGARVAFFGLAFIDTSTEGAYDGVRADQTARLTMLEEYTRAAFAERGFDLVDLAPVRAEIGRIANPADCNGCAADMAAKLGADYAVVGEVQKVSNLILSINLVVSAASDGAYVRGLAVDIRGNNDVSWRRGMRYILRNNIFKDGPEPPAGDAEKAPKG